MNKYKSVLAVMLLGVILTGCQSFPKLSESQRFQSICLATPNAYIAYQIVASVTKVPASVHKSVVGAFKVVSDTCANPPTDLSTALVSVAQAYQTIITTRNEFGSKLK